MDKATEGKDMSSKKHNFYGLTLRLLIIVFIYAVPILCSAQEFQPALGELTIEGEHIERLVLRNQNGKTERINDPNGIIELPIGEYFLLESHLEGGYICLGNMADIRVTVTENEPAVLKVGMPLKQILEVNRQGRILELNYKLVGLAGESYIDNQRNKTPGFTIHKGNKIIDSGKFEYG